MTERTSNPILPTEDNDKLIECINDEIKYAGEGSIMRRRLEVELGTIYGRSPLVKSFLTFSPQAARASGKMSSGSHTELTPSAVDRYSRVIYTGTLLATRALLHPDIVRDSQFRRKILSVPYMDHQRNAEGQRVHTGDDDDTAQQSLARADNMVEEYPGLFHNQSEDLQCTLTTTAERLFNDHSDHEEALAHEHRFILGFFIGGAAINNLANGITLERHLKGGYR